MPAPVTPIHLTLRVRNFITATPRTRILRLDLDRHAFAFEAGQAVSLGLADQPVRHFYSIASSPKDAADRRTLEFLVRHDKENDGAPHLKGIRRGSHVAVAGPFGRFHLGATPTTPVLLVAGGTGISPLRSMLRQLLADVSHPPIAVLYSARSTDELAYGAELRQLARDKRIQLTLVATRHASPRWRGWRGRVNEERLAHLLPSTSTECYLCGPQTFVTDVVTMLHRLGVPPARVHREEW
ncbi:MAG: FAD-dependent oxidoreductase [Vicinamibacterales bacterium]